MRYFRSCALFVGSAALASASVWIAEREWAPFRSPSPIQIASPQLHSQIEKEGLSNRLAPGMRAMSVHVNEVAGVAGFALPGSYVDVLVNTQENPLSALNTEHSVSKIILEKILVLAVAQETNHDDKKPKVVNAVTLEVTPQQSELLDLARNVGSLSLVLRQQNDTGLSSSSGATRQNLLSGLKTSPKTPSTVSTNTRSLQPHSGVFPSIEVIKGSERIAIAAQSRGIP